MNLIEYLSDEELKEYVRIRNYKTNDVIFNEGETCTSIGIILNGKINISTYGFNEIEIVITSVKENDLIGQYLLFSNQPFYLGTAISLSKTRIAFIKKEKLLKLLQNNKNFLSAYLSKVSSEAFLLKQDIKLLSHKNIRERILYYLESKAVDGVYHYSSISDLARTISLPRPSVSRELTNMVQDGIIIRDGKNILLKI